MKQYRGFSVSEDLVHIPKLDYKPTDKCNFKCLHCSASSPFLTGLNPAPLDEFRETLALLKRVAHVGTLKIIGGEPLLVKNICDYIDVARESGVFDNIRLQTNGSLLERASDELWKSLDMVEVSWYQNLENAPSKSAVQGFREKAKQFGTVFQAPHMSFFARSLVDRPIESDEIVQKIYDKCGELVWPCFTLYQKRIYRCSRPPSLDRYLSEIGVPHPPVTVMDGLPLDERPSMREDLIAYLSAPEPLKSCRFCLGTSGVLEVHRELTPEEIRQRKDGQGLQEFHPEMVTFLEPWPKKMRRICANFFFALKRGPRSMFDYVMKLIYFK